MGDCVLFVDDEPANLSVIRRVFRGELEMAFAPCATEALEQLAKDEAITCVVTDYLMPQISGIELLRTVSEKHPTLRRILISGHSDLPEFSEAYKCGWIDHVLEKPWNRNQLLTIIRQ